MFKETKIYSHKNTKLKEVYFDIYGLLKGLKADSSKNEKEEFYINLIKTNQQNPYWLKVQMIKLLRRRLKLIKEADPTKKKYFEFRLIVPRSSFKWCDDYYIPKDKYIRYMMFDSRSIFITLSPRKQLVKKVF